MYPHPNAFPMHFPPGREARVRQVLLARRYLTAALQRYSRPGHTGHHGET